MKNLLLYLVLAAALSFPAARATTLTVTSTADDGTTAGTLRSVLAAAADGDAIDFSVTGTITLISGELLVDKNVAIMGPGAANLAVDGNAAGRVFHIGSGKIVAISDLTITNGNAWGPGIWDPVGGGIYNDHATLAVSRCTLSGNSASSDGGGIYNAGVEGSATLTLSDSTLSGNSASHDGGGIYNDARGGSATLTISASTLSANSASEFGGGIYNDSKGGTATLTIRASTLNGNTAHIYSGGGVYNDGSASGSAILALSVCTLSGNSAGLSGGAIANYGAGGQPTLTVSASTLSGNSAGQVGGAIHNEGFGGRIATVEVGDSILNVGGGSGGTIYNNNFGTTTSRGYNISSDAAGPNDGITDRINTDPLLGPLQDNGGPTFTHAPLCGSPVLDQGKRDAIPALASDTDQRGLSRVSDIPNLPNASGGDGSDIGAVEISSHTFTVLNTDDSGAGSLREAISKANTTPGADVI